MSMTDQIADMLTRIRNGVAISREIISMPSTKVKLSIAEVLKREGFIADFEIIQKPVQNDMTITLKYGPEGEKVIQSIQRESKSGCRVYRGARDIPRVLNGLGIAIVSTNKGVFSDRECREQNLGGEILCTVY